MRSSDGQGERRILSLQPVTFHYKKELDQIAFRSFGLVAEQVAKVILTGGRGGEGQAYTVRYEA